MLNYVSHSIKSTIVKNIFCFVFIIVLIVQFCSYFGFIASAVAKSRLFFFNYHGFTSNAEVKPWLVL